MILGDAVHIPQGAGTIQFVGTTSFADGEWIGVVLNEPNGKNDGSVRSVRYFDCLPNHGVFVRRGNCTKDDGHGNSAVGHAAAEQSNRRSKRRTKTELRTDGESSQELQQSRPADATGSTSTTVGDDAASNRSQLSGRRRPKDSTRLLQQDPQEQSADQLCEDLGASAQVDCSRTEESAASAQLHLADATEEQDIDKLRIVLPFAASLGVARRDLEAARQVLHYKANHVYLREVHNIENVINNLSRAAQGTSPQPQTPLSTASNKLPSVSDGASSRVEERVLEEIRSTCAAAMQTTCDDLRYSFDGFLHELRQDLSSIRSELQGTLNGETTLSRESAKSLKSGTGLTPLTRESAKSLNNGAGQPSLANESTTSARYQEWLPRESTVVAASAQESLRSPSIKNSTKSLYEEPLPRDLAVSSSSSAKGKSACSSRAKSVTIDDEAEATSPTTSLSGEASPTLERKERKSNRRKDKDRDKHGDTAQMLPEPATESWASSLSSVSANFLTSIMGGDEPEEEYFTTERLQAIIRGDDDSEEARRLQKAVLTIQRCIRRLKGQWDAHAEKGGALRSIANAARTRNARLAGIFDRHRGKKDGLVQEAFLEAMMEAHPRLSERQIAALFEGFCGGTNKPHMDFRGFNAICDAVASGDRAACEYAHLPIDDFEDLAYSSKPSRSSVRFRKSCTSKIARPSPV